MRWGHSCRNGDDHYIGVKPYCKCDRKDSRPQIQDFRSVRSPPI